jgi:hypothetical protein
MPIARDKLCFVQFMHPGGEARPDPSGFRAWNRRAHRRKFLQNQGTWLASPGITELEGELCFWGEWEPESEVIRTIPEPLPQGPCWVQRPFYRVPASYADLQNTDPFVFERFSYSFCLQHTTRGPTQLRYLALGSVILFGSYIGGAFAIDTVFVVDHWIDHDAATCGEVLKGQVPSGYEEVTLAAIYRTSNEGCVPAVTCIEENSDRRPLKPTVAGGCPPDRDLRSYRLYRGATSERPVEGMFSFFPCLPADTAERGFQRPTINLPGVITSTLKEGKRLNPQRSTAGVAGLWRQVVAQVRAQGLSLGTWTKMPEKRGEG